MNNYDTRTLVRVIEVLKPPSLYFLDNFFPGTLTFETQDIQFDMINATGKRKLAPFVAPNRQGRIMKRQGHTAKVFRPAYLKPKHSVDPSALIPRMAGEAIGTGSLSLSQRRDIMVAENMRQEKEMCYRRFEVMAAEAVIAGQVTVSGDDYPTQTVSFGRDASLNSQLLTTEGWNQSTGTPLADIAAMQRISYGLANTSINRLTFGLDAWDAFSHHASITPLLSTLVRGTETVFSALPPDGTPYQYMGYLAAQGGMGRIDLYVYSDQYENDAGTLVDILESDTVVGTGGGIQGVKCFGAIQDLGSFEATMFYPSMWRDMDPSIEYTMLQSAPLMVPAQPNGSFRIQVIT